MVIFKKLRYKNFMSVGNNFIEIELNSHPTTLVVGKNGSGKTTVLDALVFSLFGKPYRNINKPQLVNSVNKKDCLVELEFSVGSQNYKIIRGLNPSVFEIYSNGVMIEQDSKNRDYQKHLEENILKFNSKIFNQVVVLGSTSYIPFMDLSASSRREVVESILDIEIFSKMNIVLKEKILQLKEDQEKNEYEISLIKEKITIQKDTIKSIKEKNKVKIDQEKENVAKIHEETEKLSEEIKKLSEEEKTLKKLCKNQAKMQDIISELIKHEVKLGSALTKNNKEIEFFESSEKCPTCKQTIEKNHKEVCVKERSNQIEKINKTLNSLKEELQKTQTKLSEIKETQQRRSDILNQIDIKTNHISVHEKTITDLNKKISELLKMDDKSYAEMDVKLDELQSNHDKLLKIKDDMVVKKEYYDKAASLLKDNGIKTKIVKQYLPTMNSLINKHLLSMDFFINFTLDEKFSETIKSRYRDEFSYSSFSDGEKFRINISLLLTWREIAKMKNSVNTNLLFLDEVFDSSLDAAGTEEFMKLLQNVGETTNVFVISHKTEQLLDKFSRVMKFKKEKNFTKMEQK